MLENFSEIKVATPADKIIKQIRNLITSGQINPGDRLPPERKLADKLGVSRNHVREAIQKLEFYGILKTMPQSGTVVAGMGIAALEGLITDVLQLEKAEFSALVETRLILEVNSARLAAERRTADDIIALKNALGAYEKKVRDGQQGVEEDLMFHLKIAEASKNAVLKSLMLIITPDIVKNFLRLNVCEAGRFERTLKEHEEIMEHIIDKNTEAASASMRHHLQDVLNFSLSKNGSSI